MVKPNAMKILREISLRTRLILPRNKKEEKWFEQGTDLKADPTILKRLLDALEDS